MPSSGGHLAIMLLDQEHQPCEVVEKNDEVSNEKEEHTNVPIKPKRKEKALVAYIQRWLGSSSLRYSSWELFMVR